jgi:hypothetical protein
MTTMCLIVGVAWGGGGGGGVEGGGVEGGGVEGGGVELAAGLALPPQLLRLRSKAHDVRVTKQIRIRVWRMKTPYDLIHMGDEFSRAIDLHGMPAETGVLSLFAWLDQT